MDRREIDTPEATPGAPVIKPNNIGSYFVGGLATSPEQREQRDKNGTKYKPDGTPRKELVLHLLATEADCKAGSIDNPAPVNAGDVYRYILRGGAWGHWIEEQNRIQSEGGKIRLGDAVKVRWTYAQAYDESGDPVGERITDPEKVVQLKMAGRTVGIYGELKIADELPPAVIEACMNWDDQYKKGKLDEARDAATTAPAASTDW